MIKGLLKLTLDSLAPAQVELPAWEDVLDRAGIAAPRSGRRAWRRPLVIAVVVAVAVLVPLAAVGSEQDWWFSGGGSPEPISKIVEIETGTWDGHDWELVAYRTHQWKSEDKSEDICIAIQKSPRSGGGMACGPIPASLGSPGPHGAHSPGMSALEGSLGMLEEDTPYVVGPVVDKAAEVDIYLWDGQILRTPTIEAPDELGVSVRFFAAQLPHFDDWSKLVGLDGDGKVVACLGSVDANLSACEQPS